MNLCKTAMVQNSRYSVWFSLCCGELYGARAHQHLVPGKGCMCVCQRFIVLGSSVLSQSLVLFAVFHLNPKIMKEAGSCPLSFGDLWCSAPLFLFPLLETFHLGTVEISHVEHHQLPVPEEAILNTVKLLSDFFIISTESHFDFRIFFSPSEKILSFTLWNSF